VVFQGVVVGFLDNGQVVLRTVFLNPLLPATIFIRCEFLIKINSKRLVGIRVAGVGIVVFLSIAPPP
jgi:hypothetical protein